MEKRNLFNLIFNKKEEKVVDNKKKYEYLQMLNSFNPVFTNIKITDNSTYNACINTIATHCAKLEPKHIQKKNGVNKIIDGDISYLLRQQPNPLMNTYDFIYKVVSQLYRDNNSFVYIDRDSKGMINAFYPISGGSYELLQDKSNKIYLRFDFVNGQKYTLPYEEIIHLRRFYNKDDIYGDSNKTLNSAVQVANTAMQGMDNAIKTSSYLKGLLKFTQSMLKEEDMVRFKNKFVKDYMNLDNESGIAVLDQKADYTPLNVTPITLTGEQLDFIKKNIYEYFGINERIVSGDYSGTEWNSFFESVIEPIAIQMGNEFTNKIFNRIAIKEKGNKIVFSVNRLRHSDTADKISLLTSLATLGIYTIDEAREILDMPSIGGEEGAKRLQTLNVVNADKADEYQLGGKE